MLSTFKEKTVNLITISQAKKPYNVDKKSVNDSGPTVGSQHKLKAQK